ncbi:hypothetical protein GP486_002194 [Trichoglossum hirsutum]|uniref:Kelch repeat protein n=1 Tax=Trichoglossum hirsutum TaxID=265104 RepID=A0A9P8RRX6_9PEZI|nr:hypothetical protein GP486_002194 [Trichoglossum hirsutum]
MALATGLLLLALALSTSCHHTVDVSARQQSSTYSSQNFVRRAFHGTVVIGNTLYIDGGEEVILVDGVKSLRPPVNKTLSIDLSTSWSNSTPPAVRVIDKDSSCPSLNLVTLWANPASNTFYAYGGELSYLVPYIDGSTIPQESFWAFTVDGNGGGGWHQLDVSSDPTWSTLTRTGGGLGAAGPNAGYNLGGYADSRTSQKTNIDGFVPIPGIQSYNYTSGAWSNNSALGYSKFGTAQLGGMVHVPTWGPAGILVVIGGQTSPLDKWGDDTTMVPLSNISVFEPQSQTWYHQIATGDIPSNRDRFCLVGVQGGDNSTYEIFLYGGHVGGGVYGGGNQSGPVVQANEGLDQVYVLSLPGFVWIQANYTSKDPRAFQKCHVVGGRQLLSVGGINSSFVSLYGAFNDTDPYPHGLKVFDMTEMKWTETFNASAAAYVPPDVVTTYYKDHGKYPSKWTDTRLQNLIDHSSSPSPSPSPPAEPPTPRKSRAPAAVGGTIGGIAVLILITGAIWIRHRNSERSNRSSMYEADARMAAPVHELAPVRKPAEMGTGYLPFELVGSPVEMKESKSPI